MSPSTAAKTTVVTTAAAIVRSIPKPPSSSRNPAAGLVSVTACANGKTYEAQRGMPFQPIQIVEVADNCCGLDIYGDDLGHTSSLPEAVASHAFVHTF